MWKWVSSVLCDLFVGAKGQFYKSHLKCRFGPHTVKKRSLQFQQLYVYEGCSESSGTGLISIICLKIVSHKHILFDILFIDIQL